MDLIGFRPLCTLEQYKSLFLFPEDCSKGTFTSFPVRSFGPSSDHLHHHLIALRESTVLLLWFLETRWATPTTDFTQPGGQITDLQRLKYKASSRFNKIHLRLSRPPFVPRQRCCSPPSTTSIPPYFPSHHPRHSTIYFQLLWHTSTAPTAAVS